MCKNYHENDKLTQMKFTEVQDSIRMDGPSYLLSQTVFSHPAKKNLSSVGCISRADSSPALGTHRKKALPNIMKKSNPWINSESHGSRVFCLLDHG